MSAQVLHMEPFLRMDRHCGLPLESAVGNDVDVDLDTESPRGKAKECSREQPRRFLSPLAAAASPCIRSDGLSRIESRMAGVEISHAANPAADVLQKRLERRAARKMRKEQKRVMRAASAIVPRSLYGSAPRVGKRFPSMLLVLDLDGTLVHSEFQRRTYQQCDFTLFNEEIFVYKRPYLDFFVSTILQWFDVAVWTASGCEYAAEIVRHVFPDPSKVSFLFSSERCTNKPCPVTGERLVIKDMKKVKRRGHDLSQVLIVDDTPSTWQRNYGNAIHIEPYWGGRVDDHLLHLLTYLEYLSQAGDVRCVDKRRWRSQVLGSAVAQRVGDDFDSFVDDYSISGTTQC